MSFIKTIKLKNFKQFDQFTISCKTKNILTGPNNAGKSSVLDALRILADVLRFSRRKRPGRASLADIGVCGYYEMPQSALSIPIENVAKNYSDESACVKIDFSNSTTLYVYLHHEKSIEVYLEANGQLPTTGVKFRDLIDIDLCIVPTLGPFEDTEDYLADSTVEANLNTRKSARHFRNIAIRMDPKEFGVFQGLVEESWPGVKILQPERDGQAIIMMYEEERVPREINWSGFGLQMWFQMLLQIMRGGEDSVFVLDEPDIYLHADVQRRLLQMCSERFRQFFLATHSTEIINEANPGDIVMIKKNSRSAKRVSDEKSYRELFQYLGSSENAEFARVARANRIVFFEGNDRKILRKFAKKLEVGRSLDDTDTVYMKVGGFGEWKKVTHASWTLSELFDMEVKMAALFDRDYRSSSEIDDFLLNTDFDGVCCRVLGRKEIENYALCPESVSRLIIKEAKRREIDLSTEDVLKILFKVTSVFEVDTASNRNGHRTTFARRTGSSTSDASLSKVEMLEFKDLWSTLEGRFKIIGGKSFVGDLSRYLQETYGFSISLHRLIDEMHVEEIDGDLIEILTAFDDTLM